MAYVKITQIRTTLKAAVEYVVDPAKTRGGLMTSSNCAFPWDAEWIVRGFQDTVDEAEVHRRSGRQGSVLAHHVIQSFAPGETDANTAHDIGVEFIERATNGEHDYVVATHTDRGHIHNHILFNPVNRRTLTRIRVPKQFLFDLRELSNEITRARGLSVIEPQRNLPPSKRQSLGHIYSQARGQSKLTELASLIDEALRQSFSWDGLVDTLAEMSIGVELKGEHVVFSSPTLSRPVRGVRLGAAYTEAALMTRLGREELREFVLQPSLVKRLDDDRYRIKIPGTDEYVVVDEHRLNRHAKTWRLYIPDHTNLVVTGFWNDFRRHMTGQKLGEILTEPTPVIAQPRFQEVERRGKSQAQQRYFASVDRRVDELRDHVARGEHRRTFQSLDDRDKPAYLSGLRSQREDQYFGLLSLLAQWQRMDDLGQDTSSLTPGITQASKEIATLTTVLNELDPPTHRRKGPKK